MHVATLLASKVTRLILGNVSLYHGSMVTAMQEKKVCKECEKPKPLDRFYRNPTTRDGRSNVCKTCHKNKWNHHYYLYKRFGLTPDEYEALHEAQGGVCAICGQPETRTIRGITSRLAVDHDHETGRIRGLLCYRCNYAIGSMQEDPELFSKAAEYLKEDRVKRS